MIAIEVAGRDILGLQARGVKRGWLEGTVTIAVEDVYARLIVRCGPCAGRGQIDPPVTAEVQRGDRVGDAHLVVSRLLERAVTVSQKDGKRASTCYGQIDLLSITSKA